MDKFNINPADIDAAIIEAMQASHVFGAAILFISDRQIKYAKGYGIADPKTGRLVSPDTLFTIASISKTVTATAVMTLYEQKKITLDDDINQYLPFSVRNPWFPNTPITFRMLMSHTSTIRDSDIFYEYYTLKQTPVLPDSSVLLQDFLKDYLSSDGKLYNPTDNFLQEKPGTKYTYSNTGFGLLGYLTGCISGVPFNEYCKKAIFEPLGMENTAWHFRDVDPAMMAIPYGYDSALKQSIHYGFYGYPTYPDGALKTSVKEFARFLFLFCNQGKTIEGEAFLRPDTIDEMLNVRRISGIDEGEYIGLAWHFNGRFYWHDGVDPGINSLVYFNQHRATIIFSNGDFDLSIPFLEKSVKNFIGKHNV
jgi:CubicO group peptidase (beta-lactamase class C family)